MAILDDALADTGNAERAVRLINDTARVREQVASWPTPRSAITARSACAPTTRRRSIAARGALSPVGRCDKELATLLERRLHGLMERMPPGEPRWLRALELAEVYERLGNTYEAIDAWTHVAREYPDHAPAFASLARLYEGLGQWSKVIEALTRELDILDGEGKSARQQARHDPQAYWPDLRA